MISCSDCKYYFIDHYKQRIVCKITRKRVDFGQGCEKYEPSQETLNDKFWDDLDKKAGEK